MLLCTASNQQQDETSRRIQCSMFQEDYLWVRTAMMGQPTWSTDRKHRPDDPNNSKKILLDWLTYPSNYTKFKGKVNNGTTTLHFTQIIATKMNATKVKIHHDAKQVLNKLKHLEDSLQHCKSRNRSGIQGSW